MKQGPDILFAVGSMEAGGAEGQIHTLIRYLQEKPCQCHLFVLQAGGPLEGSLRDMGVPIHAGDLQKGDLNRAPWKAFQCQTRMMQVVRRIQPQVVHAFLPLVTCMGALAGRMAGVPLVITSRRALGTHQNRHPVLAPLDRLANRLSHRVTVNSKAVWDDTILRDHIDPGKLVLIYNGVETSFLDAALPQRQEIRGRLGIERDQRVIITVANLIPYKGHREMIQAAGRVLKRFPGTKFLLVGEDRGIRSDLENQVSELGIQNAIRFLGRRKDIPELLAASDLSVLPSHEEGFSNVVLESMAAGLPVVATRVGGNPEAIVDGETGWLVPPGDPMALSEKLIDLLENQARGKMWGEMGRKRVLELFTVDRMVEAHWQLYQG